MSDRRHEWLWGEGVPSPIANAKKGQSCLLVGSAPCIFEDLTAVEGWAFDHKTAVNHALLVLKTQADSYCSLHPDWNASMMMVSGLLRGPGRGKFVLAHGAVDHPDVNVVWAFRTQRGTSGLFALRVMLAWGFDKIVLAGLPFDASGHFFDRPEDPVSPAAEYGVSEKDCRLWREAAEVFGERVRSLSGNTAEWFGQPTKEWFDGQ